MTRSVAVFGLLFSLTVSAPLWAKGDTVLIEVKGETLSTPIRITDPKIEEFTPWAGPGVNHARVPGAEGFIVDWHSGIVTQLPARLQHYEVSFYAGCRTPTRWNATIKECLAEKLRLAYVVFYDYDPSSSRGFVYLPGKGSPFYYVNMGTIGRGEVEGNWFVAEKSWVDFIRPIIAKAFLSRGSENLPQG